MPNYQTEAIVGQLNRTLDRAMLDIGSVAEGNMPISAILIVGWPDGEVVAIHLPKNAPRSSAMMMIDRLGRQLSAAIGAIKAQINTVSPEKL